MMLSLLAAAFTFTATANGLEKGAAVEFMFTGNNSDRDYETMFTIDRPIPELCQALEKAGLKPGRTTSREDCVFWPDGPEVAIKPAIDEYLTVEMPEGYKRAPFIYTGFNSGDEQPFSFMALYSLPQSPFQMNGSYPQGDVYTAFKVAKALKKGDKVSFTLSWDDNYQAKRIEVKFNHGTLSAGINAIKSTSETNSEISVLADFGDELTVAEAVKVAQALSVIDSPAIKLSGVKDRAFFYQAFLPQIKWLGRTQRMMQPFEIKVADDNSYKIVYIEEDWSAPGDDPKLTDKIITIDEVSKYTKTDTAFIFCKSNLKLIALKDIKRKFPKFVTNWYIYSE